MPTTRTRLAPPKKERSRLLSQAIALCNVMIGKIAIAYDTHSLSTTKKRAIAYDTNSDRTTKKQ
ncbi:hypothetical protein [Aerosakkonema funiforme]|uniref:Uncharacterized protein n=1 Tax=Aerosakkonema funiforme FACHB-1375 TaxID=2949571 RepID=A0A926VAC3_9CYAN|nr:hypothetical protein [Aerosakkonema funiforme]MBD2180178.1 hypothetical protein [Aerosakkonema funiforme FACHB-1375]